MTDLEKTKWPDAQRTIKNLKTESENVLSQCGQDTECQQDSAIKTPMDQWINSGIVNANGLQVATSQVPRFSLVRFMVVLKQKILLWVVWNVPIGRAAPYLMGKALNRKPHKKDESK